ncbi:MAG: hypothetical protein Q4F11_03720 [Eubacteriales bacterium]|nr:hypothetical protein [Eubacteriales bacterium]
MKKSGRKQQEADRLFWERESKANSVRKQDIEHLHYITIPEILPAIATDNCQIKKYLEQLENMRDKKILNLTGLSNTDIKMAYGAANLPFLSEYDDNFTELAKTLAALGHLLIEDGLTYEAVYFLELGIQWGSDISSNYIDLAALYIKNGCPDKINGLLDKAEKLNSLSKNIIIQKLQAMM